MDLDPLVAEVAQLVGRNLQLGIDLVDDRTGAARALIVHRRDLLPAAIFSVRLENDDLGVLSTELDDRVYFGMEFLHRQRDSVYFLHELGADQRAECIAARAGDEHTAVVGSNSGFGFYALEEFQEFLGLPRLMALIVLPEDAVGSCFNDDGLDRGGPYVQAYAIADAGPLYGFKQFSLTFSDTYALCSCIH